MAISNLTLPSFPPFSLDEYTTMSTRWKKYKKRFDNLILALNVKDGVQKKALLLNYIGDEAYDVYDNLSTGAAEETYEQVLELLDNHFAPKSNISYERYLLRNIKQNTDENIQQFYIRVKEQATKCDFGASLESEIKQQIILATTSNKLRRYCFRNQEIPLQKLLLHGKSLADAESQAEEIEVADVNLTRRRFTKTKTEDFGKNNKQGRKGSQTSTTKTCFRCGGNYPHNASCPATGKTCNRCRKTGHFERCCRSKNTSTGSEKPLNLVTTSPSFLESDSDSDDLLEVFAVDNLFKLDETTDVTNHDIASDMQSKQDSVSQKAVNYINDFQRNIIAEGVKVNFLIDSGSAINIININTFQKLKRKNNSLHLKPTKTKIVAYGQSENHLKIKGACYLTLETESKITTDIFYVIDTKAKNLLTGKCAVDLDLIYVRERPSARVSLPQNNTYVNQTNNTEVNDQENMQNEAEKQEKIKNKATENVPKRLYKLIESYRPKLFTGNIGKLKDTKIKLHINKEVPPVAQAERRIPFSLRAKVKVEIEKMEQQDIIEDLTSEATPWLSQLVIVPKNNGDVRLCVDMLNANTAIERTRFPTPTVDDLIFKSKNARYFTKLDLNAAFHQLEIDENSRYITAFQTDDRIKRFKRLIFGLNSASEQFTTLLTKYFSRH